MKRPSFQFYPGDWRQNANLRRCSPAARGVWMDVMCLMHDSDEYGLLRWPLKEIAQAAGASMTHVRELADKGVLKGADKGECVAYIYTPRSGRKDGTPVTLIPTQAGPIWYSSRMVKDEYVRTIRGESGGSGESPKHAPKPPLGEAKDGGFGPRGSSSSSSESNTEDHPDLAGGGAQDPDLSGHQPTPAGLICRALRLAGIADVNPGHPKLLALLEAGATEVEFTGFAPIAKDRSNPFAYLLAMVEGERKRAANGAGKLHQGAMPQRALTPAEQRVLQAVPGLAAPHLRPAAAALPTELAEVIDVVPRRLG